MDSSSAGRVRRFVDIDNRSQRLWRVIEEYQPRSETLALRYGQYSLAIPAIYTGYKTQKFFNRSFKIGHTKMLFTFFPTTILPAVATGFLHKVIVGEEIFHEKESCQGCKEFLCAAAHTASATLWTFILSGAGACMIASLKKTIYVPPINKHPIETLKLVAQKYKTFRSLGLTLLLGNFAYALLLSGLELREYENLKARLLTRLELAKQQHIEKNTGTRFDADAL